MVGFEAGAKSVNPDVDVVVAYADTFGDPALGKELTLAQYNQGVDIVFPVAGATGIGSFEAAKELGEGYWVIAADTDQSQLGAEHQLGVSEKGVDTAVFLAAQQVVEGTFAGGEQSLGSGRRRRRPRQPARVGAARRARHGRRLRAGDHRRHVVVPADEEQLAAFEPVAPDALGAAAATPA